MKYFLPLFVSLIIFCHKNWAQGIGVIPNENYDYLVEDVFTEGNCLSVSNITGCGATGTFSNGGSIGLGDNNGVGIILATGSVTNAIGPNTFQTTSGMTDCDVSSLLPDDNTKEGSYLQFDFMPVEGFIQFNYLFASEEYGGDYDCYPYNDVVGIFLSGPNPAGGMYNNQNLAVIGGLPVTINNFNDQGCGDPGPYTNNVGGTVMQYDGWVTGSVYAEVDTCETYNLTIVIADVGDSLFDSAVFLEGKSFSTGTAAPIIATVNGEALDQVYEGCQGIEFTFCKDLNVNGIEDELTLNLTVSGTATQGLDYGGLPSQITIFSGAECVTFYTPIFDDGIDDPGEFIEVGTTSSTCPCNTIPKPIKIEIIENNLEISVNDVEICPNGVPQLLTAQISGGIPDYIVTWYLNGVPTPPVVFAGNTGTVYNYLVQVQDACGNTASAPVVVTVGDAPTPLEISGPEELLCPPNSPTYVEEIILSANIDLGTWSGDGIVDAKNGIFNVAAALAETSQSPEVGQPYVFAVSYTIVDGCGQTQVGTYDILVASAPMVEILAPEDICMDDASTLNVLINGSPDIPEGSSFSWGAVSANFTFNSATGEVSNFEGDGPFQVYFQYTAYTGCQASVMDTLMLNVIGDIDNDGICDAEDDFICELGQLGDPCDDNNPETEDDSISPECICAGTFTGVSDFSNFNDDISIFPNPAYGGIFALKSENMIAKQKHLELYTIDGIVQWQGEWEAGLSTKNIRLDKFSAGIYYLKITDKNGNSALKKVLLL
ncbi:MAG: choice-of-anchor L domain-containing protein [Chitinophagales bacterium]|nr:T9SS type A sorting domain-containing protein [Bacteroidota bacterium]MCB9043458.1 T9SS type A sorting domain-containing protein [Chitinophagales bacterium]